MSATNWDECPECLRSWVRDKETAAQAAKEAYGRVPESEYHAMLEKVHNWPTLKETLREDYEVGIASDGQFYVYYKAFCDKCGFDYEHKFQEQTLD
jgi:hypothetical protein